MQGTVWYGHQIRLFTIIDPEYSESIDAVQHTLQEMCDNARINAKAQRPILVADGALTAYSHNWTPRSKDVDETLDAYSRLRSQNKDAMSKNKSAFLGFFDHGDYAPAGSHAESNNSGKKSPKSLTKRMSAVVGNVAKNVRKSIRRSRHKGGRRASLHMEIGSVIAMSKSRKLVGESTNAQLSSSPTSGNSMPRKLVKRISSFIPGFSGYGNNSSSVHPEKRTKSFNSNKKTSGLLDLQVSGKVRRASMGTRESLKAYIKDSSVTMGLTTKKEDCEENVVRPLDLSKLEDSDSDVELDAAPRVSVKFADKDDKEKKKEGCKTVKRVDSTMRKRARSTRTKLWNELNVEILKESKDSSLVILNMPTPMEDQEESRYMGYLEALTDGLKRVVFCHGTGREIITVD